MRNASTSLAALAAFLVAPSADASLFGKKAPPEDFSVARPLPVQPVPVVATGSIFQAQDGYAALYEGWRARKVGDPLTIVLVERTAASKSSGSKLDSNGSGSITPPTTGFLNLFNKSDATLSGGRSFNGTGAADQTNSLSGEVSVTVAQVYPNGTMLVQGQKRVTLNRGDEFLKIKGLVRTADVDANNRVLSTRVADAQISYTGLGAAPRAGRQGWLSRFFSVVSPF
jgi:flagellar L-ring protein precursor FlgH